MVRVTRRRTQSGKDDCKAAISVTANRTANMRLNEQQIASIRLAVQAIAGPAAQVRLFGSRLLDDARGGDVDLLVELPDAVEQPAMLAARLSTRISRAMDGRQVDVVLLAPNLRRLPIHDIAMREGQPL